MGLTEDATAALAAQSWNAARRTVAGRQPGGDRARPGKPGDPPHGAVWRANWSAFPRHLSQHVGGFVLTRGRLDETVPIGNAAMDERTFIEWDKDDIDALGIMKVDVLALGHADLHPQGVCRCVGVHRIWPTSRARIRDVYAMLSRGDSHRRVPGGKPRADEHAAAAAAARILRSGDRGGDRAPRPDPGRHGASLSAPPPGPGRGAFPRRRRRSTGRPTSWNACSARRSACRCSRNRRCASPSRRRNSRPRKPTSCAAPWRRSATSAPSISFFAKMVEGMVARGYDARLRRTLLPPDRGFRHLRLPGEPRRQFRACWSMSRPG